MPKRQTSATSSKDDSKSQGKTTQRSALCKSQSAISVAQKPQAQESLVEPLPQDTLTQDKPPQVTAQNKSPKKSAQKPASIKTKVQESTSQKTPAKQSAKPALVIKPKRRSHRPGRRPTKTRHAIFVHSHIDHHTDGDVSDFDIRFNARLKSPVSEQPVLEFDQSTIPPDYESRELLPLFYELNKAHKWRLFRDRQSPDFLYIMYRAKQALGFPYIYPDFNFRNITTRSLDLSSCPWILYVDSPASDLERLASTSDVLYQLVPMYGLPNFHPQLPPVGEIDESSDDESHLIVDYDAPAKLDCLTTGQLIDAYLKQLKLHPELQKPKRKAELPHLVLVQDEHCQDNHCQNEPRLSGQMCLKSTAVSFLEEGDAEELATLMEFDAAKLVTDSQAVQIEFLSRYRFAPMLDEGTYEVALDYSALEHMAAFSMRMLHRVYQVPFYQVTYPKDFVPLDYQSLNVQPLAPCAAYHLQQLGYFYSAVTFAFDDLQYMSPQSLDFIVTRSGFQNFYHYFATEYRNKLKLLKTLGIWSVSSSLILGMRPLILRLTPADLNFREQVLVTYPLMINDLTSIQELDNLISQGLPQVKRRKVEDKPHVTSPHYRYDEFFKQTQTSIRHKLHEFERKYDWA